MGVYCLMKYVVLIAAADDFARYFHLIKCVTNNNCNLMGVTLILRSCLPQTHVIATI